MIVHLVQLTSSMHTNRRLFHCRLWKIFLYLFNSTTCISIRVVSACWMARFLI